MFCIDIKRSSFLDLHLKTDDYNCFNWMYKQLVEKYGEDKVNLCDNHISVDF